MVCHLFYTERHSNRLTVINPSNFLGSLHDLSPVPKRLFLWKKSVFYELFLWKMSFSHELFLWIILFFVILQPKNFNLSVE